MLILITWYTLGVLVAQRNGSATKVNAILADDHNDIPIGSASVQHNFLAVVRAYDGHMYIVSVNRKWTC